MATRYGSSCRDSIPDYLLRTRDGLRAMGIRDRWVEGLAREVERGTA